MMYDTTTLNGLWFTQANLVDVGGILVLFQLDIEADGEVINQVILRAVKDDLVSEDLITIEEITVTSEGTFSIVLEGLTFPAMFSPTGSDVEMNLTLDAQATPEGFCGGLTGQLLTLGIPLSMSTFAAIPWDDRSVTSPNSCDLGGPVEFPRLEVCPTLTEGENIFESAGEMRRVKFILPSNYTPEMTWPLVTLWHGLGSTAERIEDKARMEDLVEERAFILAIPSSTVMPIEGDDNNESPWAALSGQDSIDLAFFDDLITCSQAQWNIDPNRVHVTGMSWGGLWTAFLTVARGDVIASSVGMSSGLIPSYPNPENKIPYLAAWGGDRDLYGGQSFDILAGQLLDTFIEAGHFVVTCDHGEVHNTDLEDTHLWLPDFSPWVIQFLMDHPKGLDELPYAEGLPEGVYPDYCEIPMIED